VLIIPPTPSIVTMGAAKSAPIDESSKGRRDMNDSTKKSRKGSSSRSPVPSSRRQKKHAVPGIELEDNFDMVLQIQAAEAKRKKKEEKERRKEKLERERCQALGA
jgi:hypothetical protein